MMGRVQFWTNCFKSGLLAVLSAGLLVSGCGAPSPSSEGRGSEETPRSKDDVDGSTWAERHPVRFKPPVAAVGERVRLLGSGFVGPESAPAGKVDGYGLSLLRQFKSGCELIAPSRHRVEIEESGRLTGFMIIPRRGFCAQESKKRAVIPGSYRVIFSCHSCDLGGRLRITSRGQ